jgi:hypothetical protein
MWGGGYDPASGKSSISYTGHSSLVREAAVRVEIAVRRTVVPDRVGFEGSFRMLLDLDPGRRSSALSP